MDTIERDQTETESTETAEASPFQQICPRHGMRVHRYHGCTKCVLEEVRRHEKRISASFQRDVPMPAEAIDNAGVQVSEIH